MVATRSSPTVWNYLSCLPSHPRVGSFETNPMVLLPNIAFAMRGAVECRMRHALSVWQAVAAGQNGWVRSPCNHNYTPT